MTVHAGGDIFVLFRKLPSRWDIPSGAEIWKVTPEGVAWRVAGSGRAGDADGQGSAAEFSSPEDIAVDGEGNLYVADTGNDCIRTVTPDGRVSTLVLRAPETAGGRGNDSFFSRPQGVAVDRRGNIYVADTGNNRICKISRVPRSG